VGDNRKFIRIILVYNTNDAANRTSTDI